MKRRLVLALVGTALLSLLMTGVGVLGLWQFGVRGRAEDRVEARLEAVSALIANEGAVAAPERLRSATGLDDFRVLLIDDAGQVLRDVGDRRRPPSRRSPYDPHLSPRDLEKLDEGEILLRTAKREVVGLVRLEIPRLPPGTRLVGLASQGYELLPWQSIVWFLVSSLIVLGAALLAALAMASRFVRPILSIKQTTAAIAAGDLGARVGLERSDELGDLSRSVDRMAVELERSKALDQQFLMSISHDLRTPLTSIAGYAEALTDGAATDPVAAGQIIGANASRLGRLVGDLLDLAKLDANRFALDLQALDLVVVAGRVVAELTPAAAEKGISLIWVGQDPVPVSADPDRLAQVITNLVDNATTFAGSTVEVRVDLRADEPTHRATLSVTDDGPGIDEEDLPFIFDRLYTAKSQPKREESATGLGLAIVKELIGAMGGTVHAGNAPEGGARLVVTLPLRSGDI